jgi:hypothetical protein
MKGGSLKSMKQSVKNKWSALKKKLSHSGSLTPEEIQRKTTQNFFKEHNITGKQLYGGQKGGFLPLAALGAGAYALSRRQQ